MNLTQKYCVPCEGGYEPFKGEKLHRYLSMLREEWAVIDEKKIRRQFKFGNFEKALAFVNKVAGLAEAEGHHPNIYILYNKVTIVLTTHAIGGLSENDFILAAKIENLT